MFLFYFEGCIVYIKFWFEFLFNQWLLTETFTFTQLADFQSDVHFKDSISTMQQDVHCNRMLGFKTTNQQESENCLYPPSPSPIWVTTAPKILWVKIRGRISYCILYMYVCVGVCCSPHFLLTPLLCLLVLVVWSLTRLSPTQTLLGWLSSLQ